MSNIMEELRNPVYLVITAIGVGLFFVFNFLVIKDNLTLSIVLAVLFIGMAGLLYNDFDEKRRVEQAQLAKDQDLMRRKKVQMEKEEDEGKCISCLNPLPADAKECPSCGFKVKHYGVDEKTQD